MNPNLNLNQFYDDEDAALPPYGELAIVGHHNRHVMRDWDAIDHHPVLDHIPVIDHRHLSPHRYVVNPKESSDVHLL